MDRTTNQYTITPATGLIPADVAKKASELGLLPQLHEYSTMNAQRRREVYPQVLLLAKALGTSTDNVKASLQLDVIFDPDEVRQQRVAAAAAAAKAPVAYSAYSNPYAPAAAAAAKAPVAYSAYSNPYAPAAAAAQSQKHTCRYYIARLNIATEELKRVKEENARLEKENATLIELLPGRGGSRKRKATRKKRH
jgi:hypothetical protein